VHGTAVRFHAVDGREVLVRIERPHHRPIVSRVGTDAAVHRHGEGDAGNGGDGGTGGDAATACRAAQSFRRRLRPDLLAGVDLHRANTTRRLIDDAEV